MFSVHANWRNVYAVLGSGPDTERQPTHGNELTISQPGGGVIVHIAGLEGGTIPTAECFASSMIPRWPRRRAIFGLVLQTATALVKRPRRREYVNGYLTRHPPCAD